jgi:hypothetical protein
MTANLKEKCRMIFKGALFNTIIQVGSISVES